MGYLLRAKRQCGCHSLYILQELSYIFKRGEPVYLYHTLIVYLSFCESKILHSFYLHIEFLVSLQFLVTICSLQSSVILLLPTPLPLSPPSGTTLFSRSQGDITFSTVWIPFHVRFSRISSMGSRIRRSCRDRTGSEDGLNVST